MNHKCLPKDTCFLCMIHDIYQRIDDLEINNMRLATEAVVYKRKYEELIKKNKKKK